MSKAFETAQQLAEALDFVIDFCERSDGNCKDCIFGHQERCCLSGDPDKWDLNTVMLNIGVKLGKEETA